MPSNFYYAPENWVEWGSLLFWFEHDAMFNAKLDRVKGEKTVALFPRLFGVYANLVQP